MLGTQETHEESWWANEILSLILQGVVLCLFVCALVRACVCVTVL